MSDYIAVKRLTASDLTLFYWHLINRPAGKQKAINLNADVFIDKLYPAAPSIARDLEGKFHLDLHILGPGKHGDHNVQRKITKGGTYKNWRLNGEYISDPEESPGRYESLQPGDFAILDFHGDVFPTGLTMLLLASQDPFDATIHDALAAIIGDGRSMIALDREELRGVVTGADATEDHPIRNLLPDADIEEAALGNEGAATRLWKRSIIRRVSRIDVNRMRVKADETGFLGEEIASIILGHRLSTGEITAFEWVSEAHALAPYDYRATMPNGSVLRIEVKSTVGAFDGPFHMSMAELNEASHGDEPYAIWRLSGLGTDRVVLNVATDIRSKARRIRDSLDGLPLGVRPDGFSISPQAFDFNTGEAVSIVDADTDYEL